MCRSECLCSWNYPVVRLCPSPSGKAGGVGHMFAFRGFTNYKVLCYGIVRKEEVPPLCFCLSSPHSFADQQQKTKELWQRVRGNIVLSLRDEPLESSFNRFMERGWWKSIDDGECNTPRSNFLKSRVSLGFFPTSFSLTFLACLLCYAHPSFLLSVSLMSLCLFRVSVHSALLCFEGEPEAADAQFWALLAMVILSNTGPLINGPLW
ncbi:hypothetical protein GOODEAATRI_002221 [Goodea atripinnis]|uniref:Uncharacterized protein n=1 Tax=Goodea atripinnis TaxID=208336 RepID=A0ABV0PUL6_9TELE